MSYRMNMRSLTLAAALLAAACVTGCTVKTSKDPATGKDKDVDIRTPMGSLSVKQGNADPKDIGLPLYPGARAKSDDGDSDSANVNISSPVFGFKVVVQKYETDDSPEKVIDFYQKPMGKFGNVLQCKGGGSHSFRKQEQDSPVTCDDDGGDEYSKQLKVGTQNNQHIVAVKPSGKGSSFVIVYVRARGNKDNETI